MGKNDLYEYLNFNYPNISSRHLQVLSTIAKIIGNYKFLQTEFYLRRQFTELKNNFILAHSIDPFSLIKYFYDAMTEHEKIKLKSFNILKSNTVINKTNRNNYKKHFSFTLQRTQTKTSYCLNSNTNLNTSTLNNTTFYPIKEIQIEYLPQNKNAPLKFQHSNVVINKLNLTKPKRVID
jgi:hypothetical protein